MTSNDPPPLGFDPDNLPSDFTGADFSGITPEQAMQSFAHLTDDQVKAIVAALEKARADAGSERAYISSALSILASIGKVVVRLLA